MGAARQRPKILGDHRFVVPLLHEQSVIYRDLPRKKRSTLRPEETARQAAF